MVDEVVVGRSTAPASVEAQGCPELGGGAKLASRYRARRRCPLAGLELDRRQHADRRVPALTNVEDFQVLEECGGQLQSRGPDLPSPG